MLPSPSQARTDDSNSINQIVLRLEKHLPAFGYTLTENQRESDLIAGHAGQTKRDIQVDVAHTHGLYPTAYSHLIEPWHPQANQSVVNNIMAARAVTCPSEWVADLLRRDLHIQPAVIPWAIDFDEWEPGQNQGYVLWNKTRVDGVCDPSPIRELAKRVPQGLFVSTFSDNAPPNLRVIGRQTFANMKPLIRNAAVGLCTTKETFCIGALEFMAAGVPILGYRHGNMPNLVKHGINGYLVEPGDIDGLIDGLNYCVRHRAQLGDNAREVARMFNWQNVAQAIAGVYDSLWQTEYKNFKESPGPILKGDDPDRVKVSVVIPYHNYKNYFNDAIESVVSQEVDFHVEIIVVDDGSIEDESKFAEEKVISYSGLLHESAWAHISPSPMNKLIGPVRFYRQDNSGVANARNRGINEAEGIYIVCLDADDKLGDPRFLQTLADALDQDRGLGIAFTGLLTINDKGEPGTQGQWPSGFSWERQIDGANQVPTACMFRRDAWRRAGGYKSQYQPAEDANLWLRIVALGFRAKQVTESPWFHYRMHAGSLSSEIREGRRPEPNWRDLPWITDKAFPLAANGVARPVRNYDSPKVSIIVPVADYHVAYLSQALDSIEKQTERYWQCIVVNDTGSPLPGMAPFPWAKVIDTSGHIGAGAARNLGVKHATAPFLAFLDADDILMPTFLEKTLKKYQQTGRYVYTDWMSLNKDGMIETHETPEFVTGDVFQKPVQHAVNILLKRKWFDECGGFDETMVSWEDVDFFMRLAKIGVCGARVSEPLFIYRYLTGQRREHGEKIKGEIIASFNARYGEYIRGEKMCGCVNQNPGKLNAIKNPDGSAPTPDQLVRVVYNGPAGQHTVAVGKNVYGYRRGGDTFYVRLADALADTERFTPIQEVFEEKTATPIPPAPPVITREPVQAL